MVSRLTSSLCATTSCLASPLCSSPAISKITCHLATSLAFSSLALGHSFGHRMRLFFAAGSPTLGPRKPLVGRGGTGLGARSSGGGCVIAKVTPTIALCSALAWASGVIVLFHNGDGRTVRGRWRFHGVSMQCAYVWFVPMAAATVGAAAPRARTAFQMAAMLPRGPAGGVGSPWQRAILVEPDRRH